MRAFARYQKKATWHVHVSRGKLTHTHTQNSRLQCICASVAFKMYLMWKRGLAKLDYKLPISTHTIYIAPNTQSDCCWLWSCADVRETATTKRTHKVVLPVRCGQRKMCMHCELLSTVWCCPLHGHPAVAEDVLVVNVLREHYIHRDPRVFLTKHSHWPTTHTHTRSQHVVSLDNRTFPSPSTRAA